MANIREQIDGKWMTQYESWLNENWGRVQQSSIGNNKSETPYNKNENHEKTMDNPQAISAFEQKVNLALEAAKRLQREIPPQFTAEYEYTARRGEFYNELGAGELLKRAGGAIIGAVVGLFSKRAKDAVQSAYNDDYTRAQRNQRILKQNLLSRWYHSQAGNELLNHGALKANANGQSFINLGKRMKDASKDYTTAGAISPRLYLNRDGWNEEYKLRFYNAMGIGNGGSNTERPSSSMIRKASKKGFNVGQINSIHKGKFIWKSGFEKSKYMDDVGESFDKWLDGLFTENNSKLSQLQAELFKMQASTVQKISEGSAGFNRIPINFYAPINLVSLLRQNLLVPPKLVNSTFSIADANQATTIESGNTFDQLYIRNKSVIGNVGASDGQQRNPQGTIAGVPIADLQGPHIPRSDENGRAGYPFAYKPDDRYKVFSLSEDRNRYSPDNRQRGFIDNIGGNVFTGMGLDTAVRNAPNDLNNHYETVAEGDSQLFPFLFETINKKGSSRNIPIINPSTGKEEIIGGREYKQYAYFQATLQSINETYNPTWSSKHFFGRTEQVHSYTMTDRAIELSFVIFVSEIRRLQNLYERVSWLAQQTYASYDQTGRMKGGPLIKMTVGDMFSNLNGFIRSLSFDWNYLGQGGKWEITQGLRVPMACSVQMSFQVLHERMPDRNTAFYPGPILHTKGMWSSRGKLPFAPWDSNNGAPLIVSGKEDASYITRNNRKQMFISQLSEGSIDVLYNSEDNLV